MNIYFDHIEGSQILSEIKDNFQQDFFSNPNGFHYESRKSAVALHTVREKVSRILNVFPNTIHFTNGATSALKFIVQNLFLKKQISNIIITPFLKEEELSFFKFLSKNNVLEINFAPIKQDGNFDLTALNELLKEKEQSLLVLPHACNETGNLLQMKKINKICKENNCLFFCDMSLTVGKFLIDLEKSEADFIAFSGKNIHAPIGCGVLISKLLNHNETKSSDINPTFSNALLQSLNFYVENQNEIQEKIIQLKNYLKEKLEEEFKEIDFLSNEKSMFNILTVLFKKAKFGGMLHEKLDMENIAIGKLNSTFIKNKEKEINSTAIRFSLSHTNTIQEIDYLINVLQKISIPL